MNQIVLNEENLLRYGVDSILATKASSNYLTLTKLRALSIADITANFGMSGEEARELKKCVVRQPISEQIISSLLNASNFVCSVCKGTKGHAFIIHHIVPYESTQDNAYSNLIVLCPSDHDLAHRSGGLTLSLSAAQLNEAKSQWESDVIRQNANVASRVVDLDAYTNFNPNGNADEEVLRYLMYFVRFTSLSSNVYNLPRSFDIDFLDVRTMMDALVIDMPHAYPFTDPLLHNMYSDYLSKYNVLFQLIDGSTGGIPHFLSADIIGSRSIAKRNRSRLTYEQNCAIDQRISEARDDFEISYRNLIAFLRQCYPQIDLNAYKK